MKKQLSITLALLLMVITAFAQEQLSIKRQADNLYDRYQYFKSLNLYLELANRNNPNLYIIERVADCYRNINQYADAEVWYAKVVADSTAGKINHYYYAEILLRDQKFAQAKEQYRQYFGYDVQDLAVKLSNCDSAALWMAQGSVYKVENKKSLNTPYSDWGLNYDGKTGYVFTSDRISGDEVDDRTGNNWFKLYHADTKTNTINPVMIRSNANDDFKGNYHIGTMCLNRTGDTAYITLTTELQKRKLDVDSRNGKSKQKLVSRRLKLVIAVKKNDEWLIIGDFPYDNIQQYSVSGAALSNNGRLIYFVSDMPGGFGKTDIWYCEKHIDGRWGAPVNCGKTINTVQEDDFPQIADDGTLYYASKGLPGMGGYDIYRAKGEKNNWSEPQNLKYPINTTSDDFYLVTRDGLSGFLSSNREGGAGNDDIYAFNRPPMVIVPPKPVVKTPAKPVITTNAIQGFAFDAVYYDLDRSNIRPDAAIELDKLAAFLKQYPELKMEVASYTDSRASGDYNEALSERRTKAVINYLVAKGIDASRLVANWFGNTNLVNNCAPGVQCTEAQHQLNRRTEFKVIK